MNRFSLYHQLTIFSMKPVGELVVFFPTLETPDIQYPNKSSFGTTHIITHDTRTPGHIARDSAIFHLISQSIINVTHYPPDDYSGYSYRRPYFYEELR